MSAILDLQFLSELLLTSINMNQLGNQKIKIKYIYQEKKKYYYLLVGQKSGPRHVEA